MFLFNALHISGIIMKCLVAAGRYLSIALVTVYSEKKTINQFQERFYPGWCYGCLCPSSVLVAAGGYFYRRGGFYAEHAKRR